MLAEFHVTAQKIQGCDRKNQSILHTILLLNILLCETKYYYSSYEVNSAIHYLQGYTKLSMEQVIFLSSSIMVKKYSLESAVEYMVEV